MKTNKIKIKQLTLSVTLSLLLGGCANLAPTYQKPNVALAKTGWVDVALQEQQSGKVAPTELGWRDFFTDPRLQVLIATALANNHDLRTAALNVEKTQAQYGISRAEQLPNVGANAEASRSRQGQGNISSNYNVGLGVSNFELDFFGRVKNTSEAALNQYLATQEARDAAQLSLIKTVAKTYYQLRTAQALQKLAKQTLSTRQKTYQLTKLRLQEGVISGTALSTARSAIATAESAYQQQLRSVKQTENALSVLLGQPLSDLQLPQGKPLTQQFQHRLLVGVPSQVLLQRPDIRQAEYALKSANANIGAARAALFPSISLTGNVGFASSDLSNLFSSAAAVWSFGPSVSVPIFDRGKRQAGVKISEIEQKIAVESYQKAVQAAFEDVGNALVAKKTLAKQYQAEKRGQSASGETLRLIRQQVQEGLADGLSLLDAQRSDFATRQGTLATLLQLTNSQVDLYTALGGGLLESGQ